MRDLFNFGGTVLFALLFAAAQLGDLYTPQGPKFTQASLLSLTPSLTDDAEALGDGTVLDAARMQFETLRTDLTEAGRG
jgi:hypothetical protein